MGSLVRFLRLIFSQLKEFRVKCLEFLRSLWVLRRRRSRVSFEVSSVKFSSFKLLTVRLSLNAELTTRSLSLVKFQTSRVTMANFTCEDCEDHV